MLCFVMCDNKDHTGQRKTLKSHILLSWNLGMFCISLKKWCCLIVCQWITNSFTSRLLWSSANSVFLCRSSAPSCPMTSNTGSASSRPAARLWEQRADWMRRTRTSEALHRDTMYHECRPTYHSHCTHIYNIYTHAHKQHH